MRPKRVGRGAHWAIPTIALIAAAASGCDLVARYSNGQQLDAGPSTDLNVATRDATADVAQDINADAAIDATDTNADVAPADATANDSDSGAACPALALSSVVAKADFAAVTFDALRGHIYAAGSSRTPMGKRALLIASYDGCGRIRPMGVYAWLPNHLDALRAQSITFADSPTGGRICVGAQRKAPAEAFTSVWVGCFDVDPAGAVTRLAWFDERPALKAPVRVVAGSSHLVAISEDRASAQLARTVYPLLDGNKPQHTLLQNNVAVGDIVRVGNKIVYGFTFGAGSGFNVARSELNANCTVAACAVKTTSLLTAFAAPTTFAHAASNYYWFAQQGGAIAYIDRVALGSTVNTSLPIARVDHALVLGNVVYLAGISTGGLPLVARAAADDLGNLTMSTRSTARGALFGAVRVAGDRLAFVGVLDVGSDVDAALEVCPISDCLKAPP